MSFSVSTHQSIASIDANAWNACALPLDSPYQPFIDHRFLLALEQSGCVSEETGWCPSHIELKQNDETVGLVPMYLKNHSRGEYVFDYAWAEAFYRAGRNYYPKYQICIPFTPVTGARILVKQIQAKQDIESSLIQKIIHLTDAGGVSSAHITFLKHSEWSTTKLAGLLQRMDLQFHWANEGYDSFDEFVAQLTSKKRKNIRRERREVKENNLHIQWLTGSDLREQHWDAFYEFYLETSSRKWGSAYLNREFFSLLSTTMSDQILLILCRRGTKYIAGALNFLGDETLYGRNWGCIEHYPFLHFELCYYQAMEYAIQHRLQSLEAGAQGGHKFARGYKAQPTYSAHYIADTQFRAAVARFLADEVKYVHRDLEYLDSQSPFRERTLSTRERIEANTFSEV
ncbi:MAG: GNAT family N-acetyltransferase [Gammaproteobacteria bacterium]|nr:GNAT family N-acetyltransferase [Gammaproteobacteria bacterium]